MKRVIVMVVEASRLRNPYVGKTSAGEFYSRLILLACTIAEPQGRRE